MASSSQQVRRTTTKISPNQLHGVSGTALSEGGTGAHKTVFGNNDGNGSYLSKTFYPRNDGTQDLGGTSNRWRYAYLYSQLRIYDADQSHFLGIGVGSNLTANRTLTGGFRGRGPHAHPAGQPDAGRLVRSVGESRGFPCLR